MRKAFAAVAVVPFLLTACETGPSGSQSERPTTSAASPATQQTAQARGRGCLTQLWGGAAITPPAADLPDDLKRWSGLYGGDRWDGVLCNSLAVLRVNKDGSAQVQYAFGTAPAWGIQQPGFYQYPAKINGDTLTFSVPALGANAAYKLSGDTLSGTWTSRNGTNRTTITRAQ